MACDFWVASRLVRASFLVFVVDMQFYFSGFDIYQVNLYKKE